MAIVNTIKRIQLKFVRLWQWRSGEGLFVEGKFDLTRRERESRPLAERSEMYGEWEGPQSDPSNWILN